jgi:DNA-binding CsgD family transcriptional regulator
VLRGVVPRAPDAWLATIARRECWARARARRASPLPVADAGLGVNGVAVEPPDREELAAVWAGIAQLPARQRDALLLREIRGLSYDQLAERLAISRASVRSLLTRARGSVRAGVRGISTALGGTQWLDALLRLAGGSSSPAATAAKVAAVGLGGFAVATTGLTTTSAPVGTVTHRHAAVHVQVPLSPTRTPTHSTIALRTVRRKHRVVRAARVARTSSPSVVSHHVRRPAPAATVRASAPATEPVVAAEPAPVAPPVADDRADTTTESPVPEHSGPAAPTATQHDGGANSGPGPSDDTRVELGSSSGRDGGESHGGDDTVPAPTSSAVTETVAAEVPDGSEGSGESSGSSSGHDGSSGSTDSGSSGHGGSDEPGGH